MLTLALGFPAGRYHATGWDHHANEGTVEWPPSPWRIIRALVAAAYKLWPVVDELALQALIEPLLAPPSYRVPAAGTGHTRHYMPTDDAGKPVKVFDAFVTPVSELIVHWRRVELGPDARALLERLLAALTYLGRAESWVEGRIVDGDPGELNCVCDDSEHSNLALHALIHPSEYAAWRDGFVAAQQDLPRKERRTLPTTWWDVIHTRTDQLFRDGWSSPPGVRRARYRWTPLTSPRPTRAATSRRHPTLARFECASAVLPGLTQAVMFGDKVRTALMSHSDAHPVFSGRSPDGAIRTDHGHAYFAPSDDDGDGRIDHVVVHAREGFDDAAVRALQRLRKVWGHGGHDVSLTLVALGHAEDFGGLRRDHERGLSAVLGPPGGAKVWVSHTPFVPSRHRKHRQGAVRELPADQVRAHLAYVGITAAVAIEPISARELDLPRAAEWYRFQTRRPSGHGARGDHRGYGFRLKFAEPVRGPIAIGYAAHYGLGLFIAVA